MNSPPIDIPCSIRSRMSKTGDSTPIDSQVGSNAMPMVGTAMTTRERSRAFFLPSRSPIEPKMIAPMGLAK